MAEMRRANLNRAIVQKHREKMVNQHEVARRMFAEQFGESNNIRVTKAHDRHIVQHKPYNNNVLNKKIKHLEQIWKNHCGNNKENPINIGIVHYNTPELTECLIFSINKFIKNSNIYIFDNSDSRPFTYRQPNIIYLDNTCGELVNFNKILSKYPDSVKSCSEPTKASFKHCRSVQKLIEIIDDGFILMDSDVLLKKDVTELINHDDVFVGEVSTFSGFTRVLPFLCFINVPLLKKYNASYYNGQYMHGLHSDLQHDGYDTGGWFFENTKSYKYTNKKISEFIIHYHGGSWNDTHDNMAPINEYMRDRELYVSAKEWLNNNIDMFNYKRIVVSLTSWTGRISSIIPTLDSIMSQNRMPDVIELNLSLDEFPNRENSLPEEIRLYINNNKLIELNFESGNTRTFKKMIPTLKKFYGESYYLVVIDDDCIYRSDYISTMIDNLDKNNADSYSMWPSPSTIIGNRTIYNSSAFRSDFWSSLTNDVISYGIDDSYIDYYLKKHGKKVVSYAPSDVNQIINEYHTDYNALHDEYRVGNRVGLAIQAINRIKFYKYSVLSFGFNNYEQLHNIEYFDDDVEYIYVTDDETLTSNQWKIVVDKDILNMSPFDKSFYVRYHPWKYVHSDICIRIDGSLTVSSNVDYLIDKFNSNNYDCAIVLHDVNNIQQEYDRWVCLRGYNREQATRCINIMINNGFDVANNKGMLEQNLVIQRYNHINTKIDDIVYKLLKESGEDENHINRLDQTITSYVLQHIIKEENISIQFLSRKTSSCGTPFSRFFHNSQQIAYDSNPYTGYFFNKQVTFDE